MSAAVRIGEVRGRPMIEVLDELRERVANGEITSLAIVAERVFHPQPELTVYGRFREEPFRGLSALQVASAKLSRDCAWH